MITLFTSLHRLALSDFLKKYANQLEYGSSQRFRCAWMPPSYDGKDGISSDEE
jgi:hypothetical protein